MLDRIRRHGMEARIRTIENLIHTHYERLRRAPKGYLQSPLGQAQLYAFKRLGEAIIPSLMDLAETERLLDFLPRLQRLKDLWHQKFTQVSKWG